MAGQAAHAGANEQEVETLSVDEYLKLLALLKIKLPKEVLTPEVIARSTRPNVTQDATRIKEHLEKCRLQIAPIPRLACGKIEAAPQLKEKENFQDLTEMIFFRTYNSKKDTLRKRWEKRTQADCGFRMKDTFQETGTRLDDLESDGSNKWSKNYTAIQRNAVDCFEFYLKEKRVNEDDVNSKKNGQLEFGFLSGKPNFLVDVKGAPEDISRTEKIIIKCNSLTRDREEDVLTPLQDGFQAEFNTSFQYYRQAQAFLFILKEKEKMEENPVPVRAVMVVKVRRSETFYWGEVREDTQKIEQLNDSCKNKALPRFLAVLNLIFENVN